MRLSILTAFTFICCKLQAQKSVLDSLVGIWKGTSLCQVKNSPCHDEIVVFHITKGKTADSCNILANKLVNDAEEEMGTLGCRIDKANNELTSSSHDAQWTFKLSNGKLEGTLIYHGNLYRIIEVSRVK